MSSCSTQGCWERRSPWPGLYGAFHLLSDRLACSLLVSFLAADFLAGRELALLLAVGGLAGLFGAVLSLRRESL